MTETGVIGVYYYRWTWENGEVNFKEIQGWLDLNKWLADCDDTMQGLQA